MMNAVKGHFDGNNIVIDEDITISDGQQVIITILDRTAPMQHKKYDLKKYMGKGEKMFDYDAQDYVRELRSNDRF